MWQCEECGNRMFNDENGCLWCRQIKKEKQKMNKAPLVIAGLAVLSVAGYTVMKDQCMKNHKCSEQYTQSVSGDVYTTTAPDRTNCKIINADNQVVVTVCGVN